MNSKLKKDLSQSILPRQPSQSSEGLAQFFVWSSDFVSFSAFTTDFACFDKVKLDHFSFCFDGGFSLVPLSS